MGDGGEGGGERSEWGRTNGRTIRHMFINYNIFDMNGKYMVEEKKHTQ